MMHRTYGLQIFNLYKKVSISRNKNLSKWNNVKKYEMVKKGKKNRKKIIEHNRNCDLFYTIFLQK